LTLETPRGPFAALEALPAAGVAERQPALLIPGYTGSKEDFLPVLGPLARAGRRVIAIDMRGQYESPAAADADGYGLAALAAEVERLWYTQLEPAAVADGVPADVIDFLRTRMLRSCPTGLWSMGRGLLGCPDRTSALAALGAPLLVVYGENDDAWAPSIQDDMARRLGAQRVCIPSTAHSPAVEAPETVASTLTTFWNSVETSR